jgi:hypothetical protein
MDLSKTALGVGFLVITVVLLAVVLAQVQAVDVVEENESANKTVIAGLGALEIFGDFFSVIVILAIFGGIIGGLFMLAGGGRTGA